MTAKSPTLIMPPKAIYRPNLFDTSAFGSTESIEDVLLEFGQVVQEHNYDRVLRSVSENERAHILPLVISHNPNLRTFLLAYFPTDLSKYTASIVATVILPLSSFLLFRAWDDRDVATQLSEYQSIIQSVPKMLEYVALMATSATTSGARKATGQKAAKAARRATKSLDAPEFRLFSFYGGPVPSNKEELRFMEDTILEKLRSILQFYLDELTNISAILLQESVVIPPTEDELTLVQDISFEDTTLNSDGEVVVPEAFPFVQPMSSAMYFESIEGFGDWPVLINKSGEDVLRAACKKDQKTFGIIVKKIKELSNGHFSDDNQKRLVGIDTDIPVYEAKMGRDSRLIYQTDLIAHDHESEVQAIKVIDICTHAQMDGRLKDTVRQFKGKGKLYKDRCCKRESVDGGNVFTPARFPPLPEEERYNDGIPDLPAENHSTTSTRFAMEKFVSFTRPLLNAIIADVDVTLPHLVSFQEKEVVEYPHSCYVLGRSGTGKTTTMMFKMLLIDRTHRLAGRDTAKPRQLFVTQSRVLAKKVQDYFLRLCESLDVSSGSVNEMAGFRERQNAMDIDMIDQEDIVNWRSDLPTRYSQLQDEHFPVITTVDQLWSMLEADASHKTKLTKTSKKRLLTYTIFLSEYWPHFPQSLTHKLDPALVFSEIMGVIKGSESTITQRPHHLDFDQYSSMSGRSYSTFSSQREEIYTLFEAYMKKKKILGDYDTADRTHAIFEYLQSGSMNGQVIDNLYVDEVQDNLLIDTLVLRSISRNGNGLFWAGDTAQTISVGSSFRFNDLKAFQYRIEEKHISKSAGMTTSKPRMFQLTVNYRSHAGIVNCAHSVVSLITRFWPDAIDMLAPERGVVDGARPVFLARNDEAESGDLEQFLFGDDGNPLEFGAQQCIIVRDEAAKERLHAEVGEDLGLIMTIYESKGLEFNDVLLLDFFRDSSVELSQWRVLLNALNDSTLHAPVFDHARHAGVCAELKFLYVAITRARENLHIADRSHKGDPVKTLWTRRNQVQVLTPGVNAPRLASSSTPEEWVQTGNTMFERRKFRQARLCYQRGLRPDRATIANAYFLRDEAGKTLQGNGKDRTDRSAAFLAAAEEFMQCVSIAPTNASMYYCTAAKCYEEAGNRKRAARAYSQGGAYTKATSLWDGLGMFDEAISLVREHGAEIDTDVKELAFKHGKTHYYKKKEYEKASCLFESRNEEIEYLEDRGLDEHLSARLEDLERFSEAAELHLEENRMLDAIRLFLKDQNGSESLRRGVDCLIQAFWETFSFGGIPETEAFQELMQVHASIGEQQQAMLTDEQHLELNAFAALAARDTSSLEQLALQSSQARNIPACLLCSEAYLEWTNFRVGLTSNAMLRYQRLFREYARLLSIIIRHRDPLVEESILKLFGISHASESTFSVRNGTFLQIHIRAFHTDEASALSRYDLTRYLQRILTNHLQRRVNFQEQRARGTAVLSPCLNYALTKVCPRPNCPDVHLEQDVTVGEYNERVEIHLLQIGILDMLSPFNFSTVTFTEQRKDWLDRLYQVMNPPSHVLGNISLLHFNQSMMRDLAVVKHWLEGFALSLTFKPAKYFLTEVMRVAALGFKLDENAQRYMRRGRYMVKPQFVPAQYFDRSGFYVVPHLLSAYPAEQVWSLHAGINAIGRVIDSVKPLPINIGTLCDFLDRLCAFLILSSRFQRLGPGLLHGLTLPRSWMIQFVHPEHITYRKSENAAKLVNPIAKVLHDIHLNKAEAATYLLYGNRDLSTLPYPLRSAFVARLARALCLLAYNTPNAPFRAEVVNVFRSLFLKEWRASPLYQEYLRAKDWEGIARTVRQSLTGSPTEDMVQLHSGKKALGQLLPGLTRVVYERPDDVQTLLAQTSIKAQVPLTVQNGGQVPQSQAKEDSSGPQGSKEAQDSKEAQESKEGQDETLPDDPSEPVAETGDDEAEMPRYSGDQVAEPTEEEHEAAAFVQDVFRRYTTRQRERSDASKQLQAVLPFYEACFGASQNLTDVSRLYRLLFLGPLPHLLYCLDVVHSGALDHKAATKQKMAQTSPAEYDALDASLTEAVSIVKEVRQLQKTLSATAAAHKPGDTRQLREHAQKAIELIENGLPFRPAEDIRPELHIAYRGIVQQKVAHQVKAKQLPVLNVEDVLEY